MGTALRRAVVDEGRTNMRRQLRIMVLDTSLTTRKILEVILRREGHRVVCFNDTLEALQFLFRHGPADLLFLSLDLPRVKDSISSRG
jgi:CheY-like chemotaxis protein